MANTDEGPAGFYQRYIARCNEHRFDELDEFVAEDVNGPAEGLEGYVSGLKDVVRAFPDYQWESLDMMVDGDRLAVRLRANGTHTGSSEGWRPSADESARRSSSSTTSGTAR